MSIAGHLSSDQIAEAKEAFSMFDRESEGGELTLAQEGKYWFFWTVSMGTLSESVGFRKWLRTINYILKYQLLGTSRGRRAHSHTASSATHVYLEIPVDELSTVLRSLGYNCPAATLQQMIVDADPQETGKISEETFLRQVSRAEHESIQSSATAAQLEGLRDGTRFFFGGKSSGEIRRMNEEEDDTMPIDGLLYVLKAMGE
ncbi:Calcium binding protein, partial [Perkinsus olseni]